MKLTKRYKICFNQLVFMQQLVEQDLKGSCVNALLSLDRHFVCARGVQLGKICKTLWGTVPHNLHATSALELLFDFSHVSHIAGSRLFIQLIHTCFSLVIVYTGWTSTPLNCLQPRKADFYVQYFVLLSAYFWLFSLQLHPLGSL